MKCVLLAPLLSILATDALAISRHDSTRMSCAQVRGIIQSDGAAIMGWRSSRSPGTSLYGRYVRDRGFCSYDEYAEIIFIPAADRQCPVYECKPTDHEGRLTPRLLRPR